MKKPDPLAPVAFLATAAFEAPAADAAAGVRKFSGTAYGGGVVTDHPFFNRVAFDLSTTKVVTPAPALYSHRPEPVGVIRAAAVDSKIAISGELFSDIDDQAKSIATKADRGMPWQLSVGIYPGHVDEYGQGAKVQLNGQTLDGPLTVFRDNRIREVSFCPLGADHTTEAHVFSIIGGDRPAHPPKEPAPMSTIDKAEHDRIVAELNAKITEQGTTITDLKGRFEAQEKATRLAAVKALFTDTGREFNEDDAKPYIAMTDEFFDALAKDLRAASKSSLPSHLASEQAKGSEGSGNASELKTVEDFQAAAKKFIADQAALGFTVDFTTAIAHLRRKQTAA